MLLRNKFDNYEGDRDLTLVFVFRNNQEDVQLGRPFTLYVARQRFRAEHEPSGRKIGLCGVSDDDNLQDITLGREPGVRWVLGLEKRRSTNESGSMLLVIGVVEKSSVRHAEVGTDRYLSQRTRWGRHFVLKSAVASPAAKPPPSF